MDTDDKRREVQPDQRTLTPRQATYLGREAGISPDELRGIPLADLHEKLRWRIQPELLAFRRLCGRVVRENPETGQLEGVPNATVTLEDTDCSFLGFFPVEQPFWWLYPLKCSREVIATVVTDECGNFCVYVPRWDLDRILRFRKERLCIDIGRPRLPDIFEGLAEIPRVRPPIPRPDPAPIRPLTPEVIRLATERLGGSTRGSTLGRLGSAATDHQIDMPVFGRGAPAPVTPQALESLKKIDARGVDLERIIPDVRSGLIGPFTWCRDVYTLEWQLVFDIPDLTFRVTQDTDGDGVQEVIYSEGYFDIRWNHSDPDDVVLVADPSARSTPSCGTTPDPVACEDQPEIYAVGEMSLDAAYHDNSAGFSTRVNRPRTGGLSTGAPFGPAQSPYRSALNLQACHRIDGAAHYRLSYAVGGAEFVPFTGVEWDAPATPAAGVPVIHFQPDSDGWYPIVDAGDLAHPDWVLWWPTWRYPNESYRVRIELADAARNPLAPLSDAIVFEVDNRSPNAGFGTLTWSTPTQPTQSLPAVCPVIRRQAGQPVTLTVPWHADAVYLRSAVVTASGCGGNNPTRVSGVATVDHWHANVSDNAVARTSVWEIPASAPEGVYSVQIHSRGRAFNPEGGGGGPGADWFIDTNEAQFNPSRAIAVIDI